MNTKYMMATKAIHMLGDISRDTADLCIVRDEDADNYIGEWVTGYGFVEVKFPKETTKELSPQDIEKYHGMSMSLSGGMMPALDLKGENFRKRVRVTKQGTDKIYTGELWAPVKVGGMIALMRDDGRTLQTTKIKNITGDLIETRNSVYRVEYETV